MISTCWKEEEGAERTTLDHFYTSICWITVELCGHSNHLQTLEGLNASHTHTNTQLCTRWALLSAASPSTHAHTHTCPLTHIHFAHPSFHTLMRKLIMDKQAAAALNVQRGRLCCSAERGAAGWIFYWFCKSSCWSVLCTRVINIVCVEQSRVSWVNHVALIVRQLL